MESETVTLEVDNGEQTTAPKQVARLFKQISSKVDTQLEIDVDFVSLESLKAAIFFGINNIRERQPDIPCIQHIYQRDLFLTWVKAFFNQMSSQEAEDIWLASMELGYDDLERVAHIENMYRSMQVLGLEGET